MDLKIKDEAALRRYLLGDMSLEEQEEIERWLMANADAYDLMEAAEDDLIDDSLAERLSKQDLDLFNRHFLAAPERQRKLQFSHSFKRFVATAAQPASGPSSLPHPSSFWTRLWESLGYRPVLGYALMSLLVAAVVGSGWSVVTIARLQNELRSTATQLAHLGQERDQLQRQLDESQSQNDTLRAQVRDVEQAGAYLQLPLTSPLPLTLSLLPGLTRSSNDLPRIAIGTNDRTAEFSLILLDDNYPAYRVTLLDDSGRELLTKDKLKPTNRREGKSVVVSLPTESLSNGDFSFSLAGTNNSGTPENINRYHFRVARQ